MKEKRRTSIFHSLSTKKDKKTGEPTAETEVAEAEPKKSPLPQKLGGLFRKPSKAVKSEETQTEPPTAAIDPAAPTTEITGGEAAKDAPVKDEPALTNGTPDVPVVSNDRAPEATTNLTPEVKASA